MKEAWKLRKRWLPGGAVSSTLIGDVFVQQHQAQPPFSFKFQTLYGNRIDVQHQVHPDHKQRFIDVVLMWDTCTPRTLPHVDISDPRDGWKAMFNTRILKDTI
jgi:hypothetical protein